MPVECQLLTAGCCVKDCTAGCTPACAGWRGIPALQLFTQDLPAQSSSQATPGSAYRTAVLVVFSPSMKKIYTSAVQLYMQELHMDQPSHHATNHQQGRAEDTQGHRAKTAHH